RTEDLRPISSRPCRGVHQRLEQDTRSRGDGHRRIQGLFGRAVGCRPTVSFAFRLDRHCVPFGEGALAWMESLVGHSVHVTSTDGISLSSGEQ
ncbi:MAG: hypothetical protein RBS57_04465, partial [Desulforhabdus sp.]|nr:hypothetical protein [Desulforhabdus sp.]